MQAHASSPMRRINGLSSRLVCFRPWIFSITADIALTATPFSWKYIKLLKLEISSSDLLCARDCRRHECGFDSGRFSYNATTIPHRDRDEATTEDPRDKKQRQHSNDPSGFIDQTSAMSPDSSNRLQIMRDPSGKKNGPPS